MCEITLIDIIIGLVLMHTGSFELIKLCPQGKDGKRGHLFSSTVVDYFYGPQNRRGS
jgi:hypothetical protein